MGMIKKLIKQHGEKAVFAIIALLCLSSIYGIISRDSTELVLESGTYKVNEDEINSAISKVKSHINSSKEVWKAPEVQDTVKVIRDQLRVNPDTSGVDFEWLVYAKPPKTQVIETVFGGGTKPTSIPLAPPPPEFRTRIAPPIEWSLRVGEKGILITCKDSPAINYPVDGSVQVMIFKKAVGPARETLSPAQRESFSALSSGSSVEVAADENSDSGSSIGGWGGFEFEAVKEQPKANPDEELVGEFDFTIADGMPTTAKEFLEGFIEKEKEVGKHARMLVDQAMQVPTQWTPVTAAMKSYDDALTEEQIAEIIKTGVLPAATVAVETKKDEPVKPKDTFNPFGEPEPAAPAAAPAAVDSSKVFGDGAAATDCGEEALTVQAEEYQPKYYAFFDSKVDENTVYRYRMVAYCKTRDIPEAVRAKKDYQLYVPYTEMGNMGERRFALTRNEMADYIAREKSTPTIGAQGLLARPAKISFIPVDEEEGIAEFNVAGLREATNVKTGRRTERALLYAKENCFSTFAYTDVVLTPLKRRIVLNSAMMDPKINNRYESARITVESIKGMEKSSNTYNMKVPADMRDIGWKHFMVMVNGKVSLDDNYSPVLMDLDKVYEPAIKQANMKLEEIGRNGEEIKGEKWDFATGWGLVDVRRCKVIIKRYYDPSEAPASNAAGEEGAATTAKSDDTATSGTGYVFRNRSDMYRSYLVIREMKSNGTPRYKRVIQKLPPQEGIYTLDVQWEPEFNEQAEKMISAKYLYIRPETIKDWKGLCSILSSASKSTLRTPGKRVMDYVGAEARAIIESGVLTEINDAQKQQLCKAFNEKIIDV
ncbi:MAG: hypothetical protein JXR97_02900, partial [Planctomycetes bacterium]|nr:hypothetical protein [Planctomycetota bacterium]